MFDLWRERVNMVKLLLLENIAQAMTPSVMVGDKNMKTYHAYGMAKFGTISSHFIKR